MLKTKIKLFAIDNLIKIAYLCRKPLNMMIPDKLYKLVKARAMSKALNTKAALLIHTVEDLYIRESTSLSIELQHYHGSLSEFTRQSPTEISFKFLGEDMLLNCQINATGEKAVLITYNIVDNDNDYPNKKRVRLNSLTINIDKLGNAISVNPAVAVDNTEFVYGYIELLFDWYSNERKIAA
jgi:hypothetical protein